MTPSSHPSAYRPDASDRVEQAPSGQTDRRPQSPRYLALAVLTWVFRVLAFSAVGGAAKIVAIEIADAPCIFDTALTIAIALAVVAGLWFLAELANAVRDIARGR